RKLGDSELAFYFPSRRSGVNDMYVALGFRAVERVMRRSRLRVAWAILRLRHPLLASAVEMLSYDDVRFTYTAPKSPDEALMDASSNIEYCTRSKDELIERYVNGPRTLSDSRLSCLIISQPGVGATSLPTPPLTPTCSSNPSKTDLSAEEMYDYELLLGATHFIGDGMSVIDLCKSLFDILGSEKTTCQLEGVLRDEWHARFCESRHLDVLPVCVEDRLPSASSKFHRVAAKVDYLNNQRKDVGGQVFPRRLSKKRRIASRCVPFDEEKTKQMMAKCKAQGVSVSFVMFALCNMAWARTRPDNRHLPMMVYSAMSLRPYLKPAQADVSDLFLAVGYFNVILPCFIPANCDQSRLFWHRARTARDQCVRTVKHPMRSSRSRELARKRADLARAWAIAEDTRHDPSSDRRDPPAVPSAQPDAPRALLGISLLGNLNSFKDHAKAPLFDLRMLTPGVRQRSGGMLLFSHTFADKLWITMNWDKLGYDPEVVDTFWKGVLSGIDDFLC
ncbi:hypothetical protein GLOTRDRAFT_15015, partial [Gloeophyllum trabeum ATCC 11539]